MVVVANWNPISVHCEAISVHVGSCLVHVEAVSVYDETDLAHWEAVSVHDDTVLAHDDAVLAHVEAILPYEEAISGHGEVILKIGCHNDTLEAVSHGSRVPDRGSGAHDGEVDEALFWAAALAKPLQCWLCNNK